MKSKNNKFADDVDDGVAAPIDGGLTLLLTAGAAYGINRIRDNKKDCI